MSRLTDHPSPTTTTKATVGRVDSMHFGHGGEHLATINIGNAVVVVTSSSHPSFVRGDLVAVRVVPSTDNAHAWTGKHSGRKFVLCNNQEFQVSGVADEVLRLPTGFGVGAEVPFDLNESSSARPMHVFPNWVAD